MEDDSEPERREAGLPVGERGLVGAIARLVERGRQLGRFSRSTAPYDSTVARSCVVCLGVPEIGEPVHHGADGAVAHPACLAEETERLAEDVRRLGSAPYRL
jgi:hypothetical protein